MSALFNPINNNESFNKQKYDNSLTDNNKCILRKQFIQIIPSCFITENKQTNYYIPTTLRAKSQNEELYKLQSEIAIMEDKISVLEINKKQKLHKIDDLRHLIRRVANEDCFVQQHCVFNSATSQAFNRSSNPSRERCDKKNKNFAKVNARTMGMENANTTSSTSTIDQTGEEDPHGGVTGNEEICGAFPDGTSTDKQGDLQGSYCCDSDYSRSDCLLQALCYWEEYLPSSTTTITTNDSSKSKGKEPQEMQRMQCFIP